MLFDPRTYPFLAHHEGSVLKAYRCPAGVITIGNGFTMRSAIFAAYWHDTRDRGLRLGDTITRDECAMLLPKMVASEYGAELGRLLPMAGPDKKGASVSVAFNCGKGAYKWKWFADMRASRWALAAAKLRKTATTANGRRLPGLVRRRAEEADIIEFGRWPSWVKVPANLTPEAIDAAKPVNPLGEDDFSQGVNWLFELGYLALGDEEEERLVTQAVRAFQGGHKQLTVDGILGRATLDQLQRVIDLKRKATTTAGTGGVTAGGGATATQIDTTSFLPDAVMWSGIAFAVLGCGFLAWIYRDELKIALKGGRT